MSGGTSLRAPLRGAPLAALTVLSLLLASFLTPPAGAAGTCCTPVPYEVDRSDFNITDRNLTISTNGVYLSPVATESFVVQVQNHLVASPLFRPDLSEAEFGLGPVPAGPDESNITPLLIVQEASSGLLRIEFIPFQMNDTYGFRVYQGFPVAPGPSAFSSHTLTLRFNETGSPGAPYLSWGTYGNVSGYLDVDLDGSVLASGYPITWATLGALYAYGLRSNSFAAGGFWANVTALPSVAPPGHGGSAGPTQVELMVASGLVGAGLGGLVAYLVLRPRGSSPPRPERVKDGETGGRDEEPHADPPAG